MNEDNQDKECSASSAGNDDHALWSALKAGDKHSLGKLFDRYARILIAYGCRMVGNKEIAKDAVQEVFFDLWLYRDNLAGEVEVKYYLFRCLRNVLIRTNPERSHAPLLEERAYPTHTEDSLEAKWLDAENEKDWNIRITRSLNALSEREREIISLKYYSGLKIKEIVSLLGLKDQTVANTLQNALTKLRKHLIYFLILFLPY
ncbi:MAG: hypothetical protein ABS46_07415 [Cytophagaceae bacterium SCN 52-12]|nr:MAG: hypothetical protein ABS46_07415 [Cytophagaceae bacterium SCN 52-12]